MKNAQFQNLRKIALEETIPFCGNCQKPVLIDRCELCGSEDLMRLIDGVGSDYGTDWVIAHILKTSLKKVNLDQVFEEHISSCFQATTKVGWLDLDTIQVLKEMEAVSWQIAQSEYTYYLQLDEEIISFDKGHTFYWMNDVCWLIADKFKEMFDAKFNSIETKESVSLSLETGFPT